MGKFGIIIFKIWRHRIIEGYVLRAQSVAPQDAQSWLGHAVAADILGEETRHRVIMFMHLHYLKVV